MFNPVAPYGYLLPNLYLCMANIANPDLSVCVCRTWIFLDITRFYEERQLSSGPAWPACTKMVNRIPIAGDWMLTCLCTAVCIRSDSCVVLILLCCCCWCLPTAMTLAIGWGGGGSDVTACGPPASFSVHQVSSLVTGGVCPQIQG